MTNQTVPTPTPEPAEPAEAPEEQKGGRPGEAITEEEVVELFEGDAAPQGAGQPAPAAQDPGVAVLEKERTFG